MTLHCELCQFDYTRALWQNDKFFIIAVQDEKFPGYIRLIWKEHVAEMTDLEAQDRLMIWKALDIIETCMRKHMHPDKINLAEFGNMVPHLHWHIIPRYTDDSHFPESIWGLQQRKLSVNTTQRQALANTFYKELKEVLQEQLEGTGR